MDEETQIIRRDREHQTSQIGGISLRGIITLLIVLTVCVMSVSALEVREPLYTLAGMVIGYYFAQSPKKQETK
jgi:hypothetical protein